MDRFENMRSFIRVVEAGSISAAAERLEIAKSVVSRRLKELEAHLGVELFHRTTRRITLTDTGQRFYQQCARLVDDILEAEQAATQAHGEVRGRLKIALPMSFGILHMGPALNDFLQLHPKIELDLDFNDREVDLIREGFDLAIRLGSLADSSLIARRLATIKHVLCASPDYLEQYGEPRSPQDLAQHRCLAYSLLNDYRSWTFNDKSNNEIRVRIAPRMKASVGEFLCDAAVNARGIVCLPSFIVYRDIESGHLQQLLPDYTPWQIVAYAVYPQTRHLSQRASVFIEFLAQRFAGVPYWDECLKKA